jgi:membrane-associated phospholipid phosphatase
MQFLRDNRKLIIAVMSLPLFFFWFDRIIVSFLKNYFVKKSFIYYIFEQADPFTRFISHGTTLIVVAFLLFLIGKFYNRKCYNAGKTLILGFISAGVAVQILKHLSGRIRPRLTDDVVFTGPSLRLGFDSFPSGHVTTAFCFAYILSSYFPRYKVYFYIWAVFIGFVRIEGIAHFPSDVLAGAVVGTVVAKFLLERGAPAIQSNPDKAGAKVAGGTAYGNSRES